MGRDRGVAMVMRAAVAALPLLLLVAFASGEDQNPVESLDAGEIAEIDDGNFVDVFDSHDVSSVNVGHDTAHMGSSDIKTALDTWETLYGDDSHPAKLGASQEGDVSDEAAPDAAEPNPKIEAKKEEKAEITKKLLKSTSVEETAALEVKLGKVKDQVKVMEESEESPAGAQANLEKDIQKEVKRARAAKGQARKTLLAAKDEAASEQAQNAMKAAQKVIDEQSEKLAKAQEDGDEQAVKASSDLIKAKNKEINEASAETLISHEHQALVANAERAMSKFLDKPKIFAKVSATEPTLVEVKPEVAGASEAQVEQAKEQAKVEEAVAEKQQEAAEEKMSNSTTPEAKEEAKNELKAADDKVVEAKVKEAAAQTAADDTAAEVAKTAGPNDPVQMVAPLQKIAQEAAVNAKEKEVKAKEAAAYAKKMAEKSAEVAKKHAEKIKEMEAKKVEQVKKMALKAKESAKKIVTAAQTSAEKVVEKAEVMEEK